MTKPPTTRQIKPSPSNPPTSDLSQSPTSNTKPSIPSTPPLTPSKMSVSWSHNLDACYTLALLFDEDEYKHVTTLQQRADLFNSIFGTAYSPDRLRDTWTSRKLQGRGKQWWKITNEDRLAPDMNWSEPDQAEKDRRKAIREARRAVVEDWMRMKEMEDMAGQPFIMARRNFRRCTGPTDMGPYRDHTIADTKFELDSKDKLIAELIRGGVLPAGTTDAKFHLGSGACDELRDVAELVCKEGTDSDMTPGKLRGRIVHVHVA